MGFLLPALTQAKLDNQRDVVKNERRQRVDNVPYGQAQERLLEALYPAGHPYHHSVIGSMADLSAASLGDVAASSARTTPRTTPASASPATSTRPRPSGWSSKYFGPIPAGARGRQARRRASRALTGPKHVTMTDAVQLARAQLVWPTVAAGDADEPALDVLAAVLGRLDKENRLFWPSMYDKQLAAEASAFHPTSTWPGTFDVTITARPGQELDDLVAIADAEIERLKADGPTEDEVVKAQNGRESRLGRRPPVGRPQGRLPQPATTSTTATRWPTRPRSPGSSPSPRPTSSASPTST